MGCALQKKEEAQQQLRLKEGTRLEQDILSKTRIEDSTAIHNQPHANRRPRRNQPLSQWQHERRSWPTGPKLQGVCGRVLPLGQREKECSSATFYPHQTCVRFLDSSGHQHPKTANNCKTQPQTMWQAGATAKGQRCWFQFLTAQQKVARVGTLNCLMTQGLPMISNSGAPVLQADIKTSTE